jgi:hypothetical protein
MAERDDGAGWKPSGRGEAACEETKERIASRNAHARKQGRQRRASYEHSREEARRAAAARQRAQC